VTDQRLEPIAFEAVVIHWRGPAPFFYAPIPAPEADEIRQAAKLVSYGWGMIPVDAAIGDVTFYTALFPKDGTYLLPLKAEVRRRAGVTAGDRISVALTLRPNPDR
jgi:hypothetical protein